MIEAEREQILERLYELSGADTLRMIRISDIASDVDLDADRVDAVLDELRNAGLAASPDTGPSVEINHRGIGQAEAAILAMSGHPLEETVKRRMDDRVRLLEHVSLRSGGRPDMPVGDLDELGWAPDRLWATANYLDARGFLSIEGHLLAITYDGLRFLRDPATDASLRL